MSLEDGMAALNLEMPSRIPRTEYSAEQHWELVRKVTDIEVDKASPYDVKASASSEFIKKWNYDFVWSIFTYTFVFGDLRTKMGHAAFADGGADYDAEISCPFSDPEEVLNFDPFEAYGIPDKHKCMAEYEWHYGFNCENNPEAVNMTGVYITLISGLVEIFGWEMLLLAAGTDPKRFGKLANRYADWIQHYFDALAESTVPVVMVHDDIVWADGPFIRPDWYRQYVFPNYRKLMAPLLDSGKKIIYTSDGNYTQFIDDIAACGVHGFVLEPTTDMKYVAETYGKTHVFIGNADTRIVCFGTREEIRAEVQRCLNIGKSCPGFFMAVGNHLPANTPVENALYYNEVYESLSRR
ncbi:MAG: hypothetical protein GY866_13500 [Proteobacteria bacterium]|nr:hypothetical protein [Pseudomonadota bacterium]